MTTLAVVAALKIKGLSCKNIPNSSDQHLFIEPLPDEKEVLWLNNGGTEIKLQPINTNQIMSNPYSEQIGHYYNEELSVEIHSRPGQSTCPKDKAEDCEYVDVEASILITQKNGKTSKYNAIGACGC